MRQRAGLVVSGAALGAAGVLMAECVLSLRAVKRFAEKVMA
jgi:hypothetical protein